MKLFPNRILIAAALFVVGSMPQALQAEETAAPVATPASEKKDKKEKPEKADKAKKETGDRVRGKVTEVNAEGKSLMLAGKGKDAAATVVKWTESTKFKKAKADATVADLKAGSTLMVVLAEDGSAETITILPAKVTSKEKKPKKDKTDAVPKATE